MKKIMQLGILASAAALASTAFAQATVKEDGQLRSSVTLGASSASGNTSASSINLAADAVRATKGDKLSIYGNMLYSKTAGITSAEQLRAGTRYDYNLSEKLFAFGSLDLEKDKIADLSFRTGIGAGLGYHIVKSPVTTWDVWGGLGVTKDTYGSAHFIDNQNRQAYTYTNLVLGEESTHKFTSTVSGKQRFVMYPNLKSTSQIRSQFDAGLNVSLSSLMNLYVGLGVRTNSDPGIGIKKSDTLFNTGISIKYD